MINDKTRCNALQLVSETSDYGKGTRQTGDATAASHDSIGPLTYLARHTVLGVRETEVAAYILTREITRMIAAREHDITFPRDSGGSAIDHGSENE